MKWAVVVCLVLLLTGCSLQNSELDRGMALRSKLLSAESVSFDAEITADYGDKVHNFSMECKTDNLGNLTFSVTAPETISGITGTVTQDGGKLTFDETAVHFDLLAEELLSPVSAPWVMMKTLRSGYLRSAGMEEERLRLTIDDSYEDDALQLDIWLDGNDMPLLAEILQDGRKILSLRVSNFQIG